MEAFVVIALVAFALLVAELVLPTGGALAAIGAIGLIASGVIALTSDSSAADYAGPALGDRVRVEAVDGLTLVVRPEPAEQSSQGGS